MDNPETQATLGTRHRTKTNKTTQKPKTISNTDTIKKTWKRHRCNNHDNGLFCLATGVVILEHGENSIR
jgi:hypothetical protein